MNFPLRIALFFSLLAISPWAIAQSPKASPSFKEPIEIIRIPTPTFGRYLEDMEETERLLRQRDTAGLEAMAAKLRASKDTLDNGISFLYSFYSILDEIPTEEPGRSEAMAFFEKWARESPQSITAQLCLANVHTSYAWNESASKTDEGEKLFQNHLEKAWQILQKARELPEKCPGWYESAQIVALGQGWNRETFMELSEQAIADTPTYGEYYTNVCYWLLPLCHGEEGDFEKWIAQKADTAAEADRDRRYARLVWLADLMPVDHEIVFAPGRLDWVRTQRGFDLLLAERPDNLSVRLEYIRLALLADDRETVRAQFEITGRKNFPRMWSKDDDFEKAWAYAFADEPNPLIEHEESPLPQWLKPKETQIILRILRIMGGLIGGAFAGILLLILAWQRAQIWAGVLALLACLILAGTFGTALTTFPAALLWLYLRRRPNAHAQTERQPSGWLTLAGMVGLVVINLGLQFGATIFAAFPLIAEFGTSLSEDALVQKIATNGSIFVAVINSAWITVLLLLAICLPQSAQSWRNRLGLHSFSLLKTALWLVISIGVLYLLDLVLFHFPDETTREAIELISEGGRHTPILFVLALVVAAPVFEEIVFRGYAFSGWIDKLGYGWTMLATSLLFAVSHAQYGLTGLLFVFAIGLLLFVIRRATGSIYPGMIVHAVVNFIFCLQALRVIPGA